jgi:cell division protein FtsB
VPPEPPTAAPSFAFTPAAAPAQPFAPAQPSAPAQPEAVPVPPAGYAPGSATVFAPTSGYPGQLPPTSAIPVGYGQPVPAPGYPVSAPGYPVSAPGYPVSGPVPPAPAKPRRAAVIVLASLMVLFLVAAGVLAGLYITKSSAYQQQVKTVAARDSTVDSQKKQISDLQQQLKTTQDQLTDANQKATGTQNQVTELTHEKQVISQCLDLLGQAADAANRGDRSTANKLAAQADPVCKEADRYLN